MDKWRPKEGWGNPYTIKARQLGRPTTAALAEKLYSAYEAGADALWNALWELAEQSPTKTFTIDANKHQVYEEGNDETNR